MPQMGTCDKAQSAPNHSPNSSDPELAEVIIAWVNLPQAIKSGILAMVKATGREEGDR